MIEILGVAGRVVDLALGIALPWHRFAGDIRRAFHRFVVIARNPTAFGEFLPARSDDRHAAHSRSPPLTSSPDRTVFYTVNEPCP